MFTKKTARFRYTFYSLFTLALIAMGPLFKRDSFELFFQSWNLWREPILAGILCGFLSSLLGVYILLNRIVFISLSLSQSASFGIFLTYFVAGLFGVSLADSPFAFVAGLVVALLTALLFVIFRKGKRLPDESLIGFIYVAASGLTIMLGDRISEGHHYVDDLLFGNSVAVSPLELKILCAFFLPLIVIHFLYRREFLFISADPEFMTIRGMKTKAWTLLLYFTLSLGITLSLRTLGSLPIFALMVVPPLIALKRAHNMREAFGVSLILGTAIPPLGYYFSFLFNFPTGASLIFISLLYLLASLLERSVLGQARQNTPRIRA